MRTLEEIKARCEVFPYDDPRSTKEHWVWQGATNPHGDTPYIYAPDFTKDASGEKMTAQAGTRAVMHIKTGKPIKKGHLVFRLCTVEKCISPHCIKAMTRRAYGEFVEKTGRQAGQVKWSISNHRSWDKRGRKIAPELVPQIAISEEDPEEIASRLNCSVSAVRKIQTGSSERLRRGTTGIFSGLMR